MSNFTSVERQIRKLINEVNEKTGNAYLDLTSAIADLIKGYRTDGSIVLQDKIITENGIYTADEGYYGFGEIVVDVSQNEYVSLEYLETDGLSYLVTDYIPNSNTQIVAKALFNTSNANQVLLGSRDSDTTNWLTLSLPINGNCYYMGWNDGGYISSFQTISEPFEMNINKNQMYINGELVCSLAYKNWSGKHPIAIFAVNQAGTIMHKAVSGSRIYWIKIYEDGVLLHDFVPKRSVFSGYGMYDRVTSKFYTNKNSSGSFRNVSLEEYLDDE